MRINDNALLKEMKKNPDKSQRYNNYKVSYLKMNGTKEELSFKQYYDHSTDIYNPYHVNVYDSKGNNVMGGCGPTIEDSYNSLVTQLIQYMQKAESDRNTANQKLNQILAVVSPESDLDD
jgi:hypothetical protein